MLVPCGGTLPEIGLLEQRFECVRAELGLEDEDRLRRGQEDLVTVETEPVGVEGGAACE